MPATIEKIQTPQEHLENLKNLNLTEVKRRGVGYVDALELCAATRSTWDSLYSEWLIDQGAVALVDEFVLLLETSISEIKRLRDRIYLNSRRQKHLGRMVLNISYRIRMAKVLKKTALTRLQKIESIDKLYDILESEHSGKVILDEQ